MEFNKLIDENGTSLASFAELLAAKAKAAGLVSIFVFASHAGDIHTHSSIDGAPSTALIRLGLAMYGLTDVQQRAVIQAVKGEFGAGPEEQMVTPVSEGKPN